MPEGDQGKFFISLSTIPARLPFLRPVLQQLVRQSQAADAVFLALPIFSNRESRCYRLPSYLKSDQELNRNIRILRSSVDHGPATKLIPLLQLIDSSGLPGLQGARILVVVGLEDLPLRFRRPWLL